jgi:hypothetical protein
VVILLRQFDRTADSMESRRERTLMTPKRVRFFLALLAVASLAGVVHAQNVVIQSNYVDNGAVVNHAWAKDLWWEQETVANHEGYISEVGVYMGMNTTPYNATLVIKVNDQQVFAKGYQGLTQRSTDWATVFPVTGTNIRVRHGDSIKLTIAPHTANVMYAPSTKVSAAWSSPTYGPFVGKVMRCFINGTVSPLY